MFSSRLRFAIFSLAVLVAAGVSGQPADQPEVGGVETLPAARTGVINGSPAILYCPYSREKRVILDAGECKAVLESTALARPLVFPCTKWFQPPVGHYDVWLELPPYVSAQAGVMTYGGGPFRGLGTRVLVPMVKAGRVHLDVSGHPVSAKSFRILSLNEDISTFDRHYEMPFPAAGALVPKGRAVAGLFDVSGHALQLSRPFTVADETPVSLKPPTRSALMVVMRGKAADKPASKSALLQSGTLRIRPDVEFGTDRLLVAIWYDLPVGPAMLTIPGAPKGSVPLQLIRGQVETYRAAFPKAEPKKTVASR
ncbi:MAG: hypothetical protein QOI58_1414 [Thermoanaerobaculia bacterium]|jgi:hypothetical protein|nr:hypothetical protein [Thermoanaerobaculia bacterium]